MQNRVVITGIGAVTSIGIGKKEFWTNILAHKRNIKEIPPRFERGGYKFKSRFHSPFPEFVLAAHGINTPYENIMQEEDKAAILSAKLALTDAGFNVQSAGRTFKVDEISDSSVILGTGFSGLQNAFTSYLAHVFGDNKVLKELDNNIRYHRMVIPMTMPSSISAWISIIYGLKGSSHTINASCASGTIAIGEAFKRVRNGEDKVVITGGFECMKEEYGGIMRGFDILDTLTKAEDGVPLPFSKKRSGFLCSDGAGCVLILEELEHAKKRGANIYAEIEDFRSNSDACNILQIDSSGAQIIKLLKELKGTKNIDYLNSHGTGTQLNDEVESMVIQKVFGDSAAQPYINSTKGIVGHTIGASGALEAAVTALSIKESKIHGNNIPDPMPNLNLVHKTMDLEVNYAISTSYGFGGHNSGLLFRSCK